MVDGVMQKEVTAKIYSRYISEEEKTVFRSRPSTGWLIRSDQAMNSMKHIRITFKVEYKDNSDQIFTDGYYLCFKSATGSWERIGPYEGVNPETSELHWRATGKIFNELGALRSGTLGFTRKYNTPSFTNVKMMDDGYYVDAICAGALYTVYCTRGISIECSLPFINFDPDLV